MDNHSSVELMDSLRIGREGILYLENCINNGEINMSDLRLLDDLIDLMNLVENIVQQAIKPHRVKEINDNIKFYIECLKNSVLIEDVQSFLYDFRFHFKSLYRILEYEVAYILEKDIDKNHYPEYYPDVSVIDHNNIIEIGNKARFKVSIVLLAYNNIDYTRDCVESIIKHTKDIDYELILVDNGSTDGTKEYFQSISNAKVIYLKYNIHLVKGFNIGLMAAEGKYCAAVCNDFIFTPNWLHNLMICIESDPTIGFVSPGATSISNMQQINIPFNSKEEFEQKAEQYNISDPRKWEERIVLLPNVLCCPTALLDYIGYYDTRFYRGEFLDDDISFRIRRAGYKLIYCADTVTHHYGSLTTSIDHQSNSLEEGRKTFYEKYDLDAWTEARMNRAYLEINFNQLATTKSILGIDTKCGATLLQIKNSLWSAHEITPNIFTASSETRYLTDLKTFAENSFVFNYFGQLFSKIDKKVDLIYIEQPLNFYSDDLETIFTVCAQLLENKGKLVFMIKNMISIESIYNMLGNANNMHNTKLYVSDTLYTQAETIGFNIDFATNISLQKDTGTETIISEMSDVLARGNERESEYIKSKISSEFTIYELTYQNRK